jgi:hypothetical protein
MKIKRILDSSKDIATFKVMDSKSMFNGVACLEKRKSTGAMQQSRRKVKIMSSRSPIQRSSSTLQKSNSAMEK